VTRIDTHQHLWDLTRFDLPWLPTSGPLAGSHKPEDYTRESAGLGIENTIYMEVDVAPDQREAEAQYVFDLCGEIGSPMEGAVIGGDPASEGFTNYLVRTESPFRKGVRQVLHGGQPTGYCLTKEFHRGLALLGKKNLLFDFCVRPGELRDVAKCARAFPDNRFVLDHCGNAPIHGTETEVSAWKRGIEAVTKCPNVVVKLSGIAAQADPSRPLAEQLAPFILFTLDTFGPTRAMFASDWPVCKFGTTLPSWVSALEEILAPYPDAARESVWAGTARRVYGL
jgi:L-fuconolactonase